METTIATSSTYSPSFNRLAERMNRTMLDRAGALHIVIGFKNAFREEAIKHAAYMYNQTATKERK